MKIKNILFSLILFTLTACAQTTPAPTATKIPPTAEPTETQIPTETPLPSPTPPPALWEIAVGYGIPQAQAEEMLGNLETESLNFAIPQYGAEGDVQIFDAENGELKYFFSQKTELLVSMDRWEIIKDIERIWENEMTREEVFSDEYFAWLEGVGSTLEWDIAKIEANIEKKVSEIVAKGWLTEEEGAEWIRKKAFPMEVLGDGSLVPMVIAAPNFTDPATAPFQRMEALAFVKDAEMTEKYPSYGNRTTPIDTAAIMPNFILSWDEAKGEYRVYPVIADKYDSAEHLLQATFPMWESGMNITALYANRDQYIGNNELFDDCLMAETYQKFGVKAVQEAFAAMKQGDPSKLSQPGMVLDAMVSSNEWFE